jgi:hypothetical protein
LTPNKCVGGLVVVLVDDDIVVVEEGMGRRYDRSLKERNFI